MPIYTDLTSATTVVTDVAAINLAIKNILLTNIGSLPGKPTFGSDIYKTVFSQLDHITVGILQDQIEYALATWEKRILVVDINLTQVPEYNKIVADITYEYRDKGLNNTATASIAII